MPVPLLATKFYVPAPRAGLVPRPRLAEQILAGSRRPRCFTLLSGPAGSGKTTLLAQLVARRPSSGCWPSEKSSR